MLDWGVLLPEVYADMSLLELTIKAPVVDASVLEVPTVVDPELVVIGVGVKAIVCPSQAISFDNCGTSSVPAADQ